MKSAQRSSGIEESTSIRTGDPRRRSSTDSSIAVSRSSASSSSISMSALRVTRNGWTATTASPGKSRSTLAAIRSSRKTNSRRSAAACGRHLDQSGEDADRDLEPGEPLAAPGVPDRDREVEREVRDERERMRGVERERRQGRKDLFLEEPAHPCLALRRELSHPSHADARPVEADEEVLVPAPVRGLDEGSQRRPDLGELSHGREAVRRRLDHPLGQLALQPCDPDHEELVQVVREDREELHPLEERVRRVERLLEHAAVELDPARLPVDEQSVDGRGSLRLPGAVRPGLCLGHSLSPPRLALQYSIEAVRIYLGPARQSLRRAGDPVEPLGEPVRMGAGPVDAVAGVAPEEGPAVAVGREVRGGRRSRRVRPGGGGCCSGSSGRAGARARRGRPGRALPPARARRPRRPARPRDRPARGRG